MGHRATPTSGRVPPRRRRRAASLRWKLLESHGLRRSPRVHLDRTSSRLLTSLRSLCCARALVETAAHALPHEGSPQHLSSPEELEVLSRQAEMRAPLVRGVLASCHRKWSVLHPPGFSAGTAPAASVHEKPCTPRLGSRRRGALLVRVDACHEVHLPTRGTWALQMLRLASHCRREYAEQMAWCLGRVIGSACRLAWAPRVAIARGKATGRVTGRVTGSLCQGVGLVSVGGRCSGKATSTWVLCCGSLNSRWAPYLS